MSVLIETGRSIEMDRHFGWTWKLEYVTSKYQKDGEWKEIGEVSWTAIVDGYMIFHDDVNGRFLVTELSGAGGIRYATRLVGETGSPLEAMRLARLDHRAVLARAEAI